MAISLCLRRNFTPSPGFFTVETGSFGLRGRPGKRRLEPLDAFRLRKTRRQEQRLLAGAATPPKL